MTTDFGSRINAYRDQPEQQRARAARRAAKAELWAKLPELLGRGSARTASGWNLPVTPDETSRGRPIGNQHPGTAAVIVVRQALGQYKLPSEVDLRYVGMKRISGHGASAMDEGIVFIEANFQAVSGPKFAVDVPVIVHEGRMLDPSILIHAGNPRVITQNTFDDILGSGEFTMKTPDRPHMFSPPPDKNDRTPRERVKIHRPGMFDVPPPRSLMQNKLRASIASAVTGIRQPDAGKVRRAQVEWVEPAREWLTSSGHDVGDVWLMREHELFRQLNQLYPGGAGEFIAQHQGQPAPQQQVAADAVMGIAARRHVAQGGYADDLQAPAQGATQQPARPAQPQQSPAQQQRRQYEQQRQQELGQYGPVTPRTHDFEVKHQQTMQDQGRDRSNNNYPGYNYGPNSWQQQQQQQQTWQQSGGTEHDAGPHDADDPAWADTGDTGWGDEPGFETEPDWAESGSGESWGAMPTTEPAEPEWPAGPEGAGGGAWGSMDAGEAAHQFLYEMPDFDWSEEQVAAAHAFAEQNGVDLASFMDALNDAEYQKARPAPHGPGGGGGGPGGGGGGPVESYDEMRRISPLDDPDAGKHGDAPPGREEQVKELKDEPGVDNPYAVAWSSYDKSHDKHSDGGAGGATKPKPHFPTLPQPRPAEPAPAKKHFPTLHGAAVAGRRTGFYAPDVTGYVEPGTVGADVPGADGSHIDVGERPVAGAWGAGQRVRTTKVVVTRDRGGVRYMIPRGTSGTVLRDVDGADRAYIVKFPELGYATTVSKESLR